MPEYFWRQGDDNRIECVAYAVCFDKCGCAAVRNNPIDACSLINYAAAPADGIDKPIDENMISALEIAEFFFPFLAGICPGMKAAPYPRGRNIFVVLSEFELQERLPDLPENICEPVPSKPVLNGNRIKPYPIFTILELEDGQSEFEADQRREGFESQ